MASTALSDGDGQGCDVCPSCRCAPLWPLIFYSSNSPSRFTPWLYRFLPFLFTLVVKKPSYTLLIDQSSRPSSSFFFSVLMLLFSVTKDERRVCIDLLYPLFQFEFSWDPAEREYEEERAVEAIRGTRLNEDGEESWLWSINFRILPLAMGHFSRKQAWVCAIAPVPLYFSFQRKLGLLLGEVPELVINLHAFPFISLRRVNRPRYSSLFVSLLYVFYLDRQVNAHMANTKDCYTALVLFPLVWCFSWHSGWIFSFCVIFWVGGSKTKQAGFLLFLPILITNWCWGFNRELRFTLGPFLWIRYSRADQNFQLWLLPFIFFTRSAQDGLVCILPLFFYKWNNQSVLWSLLMLFWFYSSRSSYQPASHKCCFLAPVFYCSSSLCPSCCS